MQQPDSERKIETIIDGEQVCGTVYYGGATEIAVQLDQPVNDWSISLHMPTFARSVYREGFLGEYGEQRALELLCDLYKEQKKGDRRGKFADVEFEEFGRVRYLAVNPGHPGDDRKILDQAEITSTIRVQIEDDGPYGLARFFDSGTNQPFLAESAVYEENIQQYVDGVKADLSFRQYLKTIRRRLLPDMVRSAALLKSHRLSVRQVHLLDDFGQFWRAGMVAARRSGDRSTGRTRISDQRSHDGRKRESHGGGLARPLAQGPGET